MPTFTENWFNTSSRRRLATLVRAVELVEGRIVELGSWEGRSTIALAGAAGDRTVHAVDHWNGAASDSYQREQAASRDVFATFSSNIAAHPNVVPFRMDWREYCDQFDTAVALVFIDADHTTAEVRAQIAAFRPLMSRGGIICDDDYQMRQVARAVHILRGFETVGPVWSWRAP